jgi:hypothetical protein
MGHDIVERLEAAADFYTQSVSADLARAALRRIKRDRAIINRLFREGQKRCPSCAKS